MPSMANITVKASNGTTDVVYTALTPSAGDTVPAQWRVENGSQNNAKPMAKLVSRWNQNKSARRMDFMYEYPQTATDTTTGLVTVVNRIPISLTMALPAAVPDTVVAEAVAQATNLLVSTLIRASMNAGFSPT